MNALKISLFFLANIWVANADELDSAIMKDVENQLRCLESDTPEQLGSKAELDELIMKTVKIAFTVGCDAYESLITGKFKQLNS